VSRTVIRGGLVVTAADEVEADVLVEGERIVAVAERGSAFAESWTADQIIDATGDVIPGGVDAHTHLGFGPGPDDYDADGNVSSSPVFGGGAAADWSIDSLTELPTIVGEPAAEA
jgi:dihydropyrimidinase